MRIIAGHLGGRTLRAPPGRNTRPTSDRTREALFAHLESAILEGGFEGVRVVDLYAGSGALALEALSRGAAHAVCVDHDLPAIRTIASNAQTLGVIDRLEVVRASLPAALRRIGDPAKIDLIFIDPPYALTEVPDLLGALAALPVRDGAVAVWESDARNHQTPPDAWTVLSDRRAGDTRVRVLARGADATRRT